MKQERTFTRLSTIEAKDLLKTNPHVFDTRDQKSFAAGHIQGATLLDRSTLDEVLIGTKKQDPVLIYCYQGNASQVYGQMFADFGFTQVYDLVGGYDAWCLPDQNSMVTKLPSPALRAWLAEQGFAGGIESTIANATTPLMQAARLGSTAIAHDLIALGASVAPLNSDGNNALWLACFSGNLELIDLLIKAGINIDHQNDNGATCLMYAASAGKDKVVALLLNSGADVALKSLDDFSAVDMSASIECLRLQRGTLTTAKRKEIV